MKSSVFSKFLCVESPVMYGQSNRMRHACVNRYPDKIANAKWEVKELGIEHNGYAYVLLNMKRFNLYYFEFLFFLSFFSYFLFSLPLFSFKKNF